MSDLAPDLNPADVRWARGGSTLLSRGQVIRHVARGREADLLAVGDPPVAMLKRWFAAGDHASISDTVLRHLYPVIPVPRPLGWGWDRQGRSLLAMAPAGRVLSSVDVCGAAELGRLLARIHRHADPPADIPRDRTLRTLAERLIPNGAPPELHRLRDALVALLPPAEGSALCHGDFHPGNVLHGAAGMIVADWAGARLSYPQYDLAWALVLLFVYYPAPLYPAFLEAYGADAAVDDVAMFEALAALRWQYLARTAPVPINEVWQQRAAVLLGSRLPESLRDLLPADPGPPR